MAHFYLSEALSAAEPGATVELTGTEARHAATVSRVRRGERIAIGNGRGLVVAGEVSSADPSRVTVAVAEVTARPRPAPRLWLAQALAKGDRDELAVQAACELGIDGVLPWAAQRSVSRWQGIKAEKGRERWSAIVREAAKQSMRPWLPEVGALVTTRQLAALPHRLVVLEPGAEVALTALPLDDRDLVLVVGPEGGIAPEELEAFRAAGGSLARLGDSVLRTSTAGPAAIAVLNARLGRW